jgi:hypothetical protein
MRCTDYELCQMDGFPCTAGYQRWWDKRAYYYVLFCIVSIDFSWLVTSL